MDFTEARNELNNKVKSVMFRPEKTDKNRVAEEFKAWAKEFRGRCYDDQEMTTSEKEKLGAAIAFAINRVERNMSSTSKIFKGTTAATTSSGSDDSNDNELPGPQNTPRSPRLQK